MIELNVINASQIEIKFGTCAQTHEQILSIYVRTIKDALAIARGNYEALANLEQLFKEARWCAKDLKNQAWLQKSEVTL